MSSTTFEIVRIDRSLGPARRTALRLGPIETDPRDTACFVQVREEGPHVYRVIAEFWYPYERGPMTPAALVAILRPLVQTESDGDLSGRGEAQLVGQVFRL